MTPFRTVVTTSITDPNINARKAFEFVYCIVKNWVEFIHVLVRLCWSGCDASNLKQWRHDLDVNQIPAVLQNEDMHRAVICAMLN